MIQFHSLVLNDGLTPTVELFAIEPVSAAQQEDAGWYYQLSVAGQEIGDPQGPYPSDAHALQAARGLFVPSSRAGVSTAPKRPDRNATAI